MQKISFLIFVALFFVSCNNNNTKTKSNKIATSDTTYNKIEFYCFCMHEEYINHRAVLMSVCGDKDAVTPNKLVSKEHYYDSICDKERLDRFTKLFLSSMRKIIAQPTYPNSRFAFLLKSKTTKTDTVFWNMTKVTYDSVELNLN